MKYVLYSSDKNRYLKDKDWTKKLSAATKFNNLQSAENAIKCNYKIWLNEQHTTVSAIPYDEKTKIFSSVEQAEEEFNSLFTVTENFGKGLDNLDLLIANYVEQLSTIDSAQEDVLHKIELDNVIGIQAVRLVKQLKEIRIKRRKIKDVLEYLTIIKKNTMNFKKQLGSYHAHLGNRSYNPRVLNDLFN
jgi:hypothetical protein